MCCDFYYQKRGIAYVALDELLIAKMRTLNYCDYMQMM